MRFLAAPCLALSLAAQPSLPTAELKVMTDEAEAVLAILAERQEGREPAAAQWQRLFASDGYRRLKAREAAMKRPFEDSAFRTFVPSAELAARATALRETLARWRSVDLQASARRILAYLPAGARIRATVYFVIKPQTNSFVFDLDKDPAIFMYLDPAVSPQKLENTVAHELHHVGLQSALNRLSVWKDGGDTPRDLARSYVGAFGEGFAMLAAAGGPEVHPHAASPEETRARWDKDMARFASDLREVDAFLLDVASGRLRPEAAQEKAMATFWGTQGAWYTVGYRMAALIETTFGRERLLACMEDLSKLLPTYNEAARLSASKGGESLPLWSDALLSALSNAP